MIRCSIHNHTTYCDGRDSAEDVIRAAIAQGFETVGISEHSVFPEDPPSGMTPEGEPALFAELMALREKYKGQIHVAAGIEQDTFSPPQQMPWEYVIGAVHYIRTDEGLTAVDLSPDVTKACIDGIFCGDAMAFAACYYRTLAEVVERTDCDVIAHFDLLTKFKEIAPLIDTKSLRYRRLVSDTLDALLPADRIFEINSGAMSRGYRAEPYPGDWILRELNRRGARIMLSSDSHAAVHVGYAFPQMAAYAKRCGFHTGWVLTAKGWEEEVL